MSKNGPIVVVEDDEDDIAILKDILEELGITNELVWFSDSIRALEYLQNTPVNPFVIFSDVNLPMQNGIEFKRQIDENPELRKKSIPFVFFSTSVEQKFVDEAYSKMTIQGFFQKPSSYHETREVVSQIIAYWRICRYPNSGD